MSEVSVAIPVRDGGRALDGVLAALGRQTVDHELLICDSGSSDGSLELARAHGAEVLEIAPSRFNHGAVRNLLMARASGGRVAFLTEDAEPADERWLERLLGGLALASDVAIAYGPYRPRPNASAAVQIELRRWFGSLSPDGQPRVERLDEHERATLPAVEFVGRRGFFTDSNACVSREAWRRVPFREVSYAEDRVLAIDMLRAGYAKAYVPDAAVAHSHDYTALEQLRRSFDEARALREVYGWREPASPRELLRRLRGELAAARAQLPPGKDAGTRAGTGTVAGAARAALLAEIAAHQLARMSGALLGSRAERLAPAMRRRLSLEGRGEFVELHLDDQRRVAAGAPTGTRGAPS